MNAMITLVPYAYQISLSVAVIAITYLSIVIGELRQMIKTASNEGVIEEEQNEIHEKLFYFSDKRAYHIMTHRTDIEWLDINESPTEIQKFINNSKYSKIICCDDSLDNFKGVMYVNEYYRIDKLLLVKME
jgi:putative hemolysin